MIERISITGAEPVDIATAKLAARVDGDELDTLIGGYIATARGLAETITGRFYRKQVRRQTFASWPSPTTAIKVHGASECVVSYWNGTTWEAVAAQAFVFTAPLAGSGTVIAPAVGTTWPELGDVAAGARVRVDLTVGDPNVRAAPDCVKDFICANVAGWVNNPDALVSVQLQPNPYLERLLDEEKLWL